MKIKRTTRSYINIEVTSFCSNYSSNVLITLTPLPLINDNCAIKTSTPHNSGNGKPKTMLMEVGR
jgi:hypothetical protein